MMNQPMENIEVIPAEGNLQHWTVTMHGPVSSPLIPPIVDQSQLRLQANTPYAGGKFNLVTDFSLDYPFKPPTASNRSCDVSEETDHIDQIHHQDLSPQYRQRWKVSFQDHGNVHQAHIQLVSRYTQSGSVETSNQDGVWYDFILVNQTLYSFTVFLSIYDLLEKPNPDDPLVASIVS